MSRLGKKPIAIPAGAKIQVQGRKVNVEGPKGKLSWEHPVNIKVAVDGAVINVSRTADAKQDRANHGLTRALVNNMVNGVTTGFRKDLTIVGVGWNAKLEGKKLNLQIGFCHPVILTPPEGVKIEVPQPQTVVISGTSRHEVGQFAAQVRDVRPPEPYNQKGIRYADEVVRKKSGKAFVGGGGA